MRMICTASRICARAGEKRSPCHCSTMTRLDSPRPSDTRPGAKCASAAALCPSTTGVRVCTGTTAHATCIRRVRLAIIVITVKASQPETSPVHAV